jgi:deoxyribodipyrimidine photo-lyase
MQSKEYELGVFIFRRDMRLDDNHGLYELTTKCKCIMPIFILDKNQIVKNKNNKYYFSNNAVQFMCESLIDLDKQLHKYNSRLFLFFGYPWEITARLLVKLKSIYNKICIGYNCDYSKYSQKRDSAINVVCNKLKINIYTTHTDYTLLPFDELLHDGNPFKQYGAFYKNAIKKNPTKSFKNKFTDFLKKTVKMKDIKEIEYDILELSHFYTENEFIAQHGGRTELIKKLKTISKFNEYNELRDQLNYNTTNLSAGLNYGCISVREAFEKIYLELGKNSQILKQLYWRDFFLCAFRFIPNGDSYKFAMDKKYDKIKWVNSKEDWKTLMNSNTGFLLIDAGINQMKQTGFLHNRLRMMLVSFWTKYLLISIFHPKYGSQVGYSAMLVDAVGPSQNKINHNWVLDFDYSGRQFSKKGTLSGRPMSISNDMIKKFDKECIYIKKWLPHLDDIPNKDLYKWNKEIAKKYNNIHPSPMFDDKEKYKEWIKATTI